MAQGTQLETVGHTTLACTTSLTSGARSPYGRTPGSQQNPRQATRTFLVAYSAPRCCCIYPVVPPLRRTQPSDCCSRPFDIVETDIKGPLSLSPDGYRYILVFQHAFSKYAEMTPIATASAHTVSIKLREWIRRYGIPRTIHSDQGACYTSTTFNELCAKYGIRYTVSSAYHPQANGSVERLNRSIGTTLAKVVHHSQTDWPDRLPEVQLAYNSAKHDTINASPFRIILNREPAQLQIPWRTISNPHLKQIYSSHKNETVPLHIPNRQIHYSAHTNYMTASQTILISPPLINKRGATRGAHTTRHAALATKFGSTSHVSLAARHVH